VILVIAGLVFYALVLFLAWAMCRMSAISQERADRMRLRQERQREEAKRQGYLEATDRARGRAA
jgi:Na+-transporting methylmalonyl-CoA/oxaloacetate decarboxylase gamma subunit